MPAVNIKSSNRSIRRYRAELDELRQLGIEHEGGLRLAFGNLLRGTAGKGFKWINELPVAGSRVRPDATLIDDYHLPHGHWEAKDGRDDLEVEIRNKRERGYPFSNIIFEDTQSAVLFQNERRILKADCKDRKGLAELLTRFYRHETPDFSSFEEAVGRFSDEVPQLAQGLQDRIEIARVQNAAYQRAFADFSDKQRFINTVYERFFQGFSVKVADTHGIVYTPQEVVEFMVAATDELLQREFGKKLGDEGVCVIDPCTGTGNFVVQLLRRVARENPRELDNFYRERLFANEVMLMPYYIASLNIEHEYHHRSGRYEPFEGLCFVDTLDLAEGDMPEMFQEFSQKNSARVERQKAAKINVVIGNPPYNVGQVDENDNNKNRKYPVVEERIRETYAKDSCATLKTQLYDPYVKFFRWAIDRLEGGDGIVCFVSNNSFMDAHAFDGFRKHFMEDFTRIWHLDLHGNVRRNPKISGTTHNVFGIQVGVGITVALRCATHKERKLFYHRVPEYMVAAEKLGFMHDGMSHPSAVSESDYWRQLDPDPQYTWLPPENHEEFATFKPLGLSKSRARLPRCAVPIQSEKLFHSFSGGVKTNRDAVVHGFGRNSLVERMGEFVENYNAEVDRYIRHGRPKNVDNFVNYSKLKWSSTLKSHLKRGRYAEFSESNFRQSIYRPYTVKGLYFDCLLVDRCLQFPHILPTQETEQENLVICTSGIASNKPFEAIVVDLIPNYHIAFNSQCFPLYTYDADGTNRRENVTDWALATFRDHYGDPGIEKLDIFHYVYGLLHHPGYRERHADSLRRELPRIPLAPDFAAFRDAGRELAWLHLNYERERVWDLEWEVDEGRPIDYRVEKMRPLKRVQSEDGDYRIFDSLEYNDTLTLRGIPAEAFRYRLGTRSALEWVIDQYRVKTDKRSGIVSDPNAWADDRYIVDLVGRVITVSVETVKIVDGLAGLALLEG